MAAKDPAFGEMSDMGCCFLMLVVVDGGGMNDYDSVHMIGHYDKGI